MHNGRTIRKATRRCNRQLNSLSSSLLSKNLSDQFPSDGYTWQRLSGTGCSRLRGRRGTCAAIRAKHPHTAACWNLQRHSSLSRRRKKRRDLGCKLPRRERKNNENSNFSLAQWIWFPRNQIRKESVSPGRRSRRSRAAVLV